MTDKLNISVFEKSEPDIYTILKNIVSTVSTLYGKSVFWTFGPGREIVESMIAMSNSSTSSAKKYPFIALVGNTPIQMGDSTCYGVATCQVIIGTLSDINTKAEQRMVRSYQAVLQPIYKIFKQALFDSGKFDIQDIDKLEFEQVLNFNYAKGFDVEGMKYPDIIDVIELRNLKLRIKY
ncbi:MAG TPA: hypothetical protein PKH58_10485 [Paludibacteraceae bacterium]|nr:hypothetical protein [Paludibacteraceae bacterium]